MSRRKHGWKETRSPTSPSGSTCLPYPQLSPLFSPFPAEASQLYQRAGAPSLGEEGTAAPHSWKKLRWVQQEMERNQMFFLQKIKNRCFSKKSSTLPGCARYIAASTGLSNIGSRPKYFRHDVFLSLKYPNI